MGRCDPQAQRARRPFPAGDCQALAVDPNLHVVRFQLALLYAGQGQSAAAWEEFGRLQGVAGIQQSNLDEWRDELEKALEGSSRAEVEPETVEKTTPE